MSDLENMLEVEKEKVQPDEVVATDSEATSTEPQGDDTEQVSFYIEDEGDQQETPNEELKRRAAFAKKKQQAREAKEAQRKAEEEREATRRENEELKRRISAIEAGPKPNPDDYYGETDKFYSDLKAWNEKVGGKQAQPEAKPQQQYTPDDMAQYVIEQGAEKLKTGGITDYDEKQDSVRSSIQSLGVNPDMVLDQWANRADEDGSYNAASAIYMIGRNPSVLQEIAAQKTLIGINKVLKREALKVKPRREVKTGIKPNPEISSSGPIDNASAKVKKLRDEWQADPTNISKSNAYFEAKRNQNKGE